jgi:hypothetical protein
MQEQVGNNDNVAPKAGEFADVHKVSVTGQAGQFTFAVTIASPDTGCDQFADWWEVISEDGKLLYRRILLHSHVNEQPFTRTGGIVDIEAEKIVYVRAHMNNTGYGGKIMKGSVETGFKSMEMPTDFALGLEKQAPLPEGCDF